MKNKKSDATFHVLVYVVTIGGAVASYWLARLFVAMDMTVGAIVMVFSMAFCALCAFAWTKICIRSILRGIRDADLETLRVPDPGLKEVMSECVTIAEEVEETENFYYDRYTSIGHNPVTLDDPDTLHTVKDPWDDSEHTLH